MAMVSSANRVSVSFGDRVVAVFTVALQALQRRRAYWATLRELNALTDRELADMGLIRADLAGVAREAAYGAAALN